MECPIDRKREVLIAYCAARLPADEAEAVELHLRECPQCERFVRGQSAVWNRLGEFDAPPVSENFDRLLWARIESGQHDRWWQFPLWKPVLSLALACLLIIAAVLVRRSALPAVPQQVQAEAMDAEHIERALDDFEMLRELDLPDEGQAM